MYLQVFYSIGYAGMTFAIDVITADTSSLRDRGLAYAFTSSPYIITAYAGPAAAEKFYADNWRWAYGAFAIILPVIAAPMVGILKYAKSQAKKQGLLPPIVSSGRTPLQSLWHYVIEFDCMCVSPALALRVALLTTSYSARDVPSGRWTCYFPPSLQHQWNLR